MEGADPIAMSTGAPGLPPAFRWKQETLTIATVIRNWKESGPCRNGGAESYIRKHWFEVEMTDNRHAKLYFERQPRGRNIAARWWLFTIEELPHPVDKESVNH